MTAAKPFDGSRRHVLDWVESSAFLDTVRNWVHGQGLSIADNTNWMPKSWAEPDESKLFDPISPFLAENHKAELRGWWLVHAGNANIPNWDLIVAATATSGPALVLVEAKAHTSEFDSKPKSLAIRETPEAQRRTNENHERIGHAIDEASRALSRTHSGISISRDVCYQLSNRIAMAWKLAFMGIPNTLVFLGFTGDREIAKERKFFADDTHWQHAFAAYSSSCFPSKLLDQDILSGLTSFRVIARSLPAKRSSRPVFERRLG
jgi:hypothetical protein